VSVSVDFKAEGILAGIERLGKRLPRAVRRALTRTGTSARAQLGTLIAEDTGLPARAVKLGIAVTITSDTKILLSASDRRVPLIEFKARGPEPSRGQGRGVSYRLPGGRGRLEHAFIATMSTGHRGVFQRADDGPRLPIREKYGPSLGGVFRKHLATVEERAQKTLVANLRHEIDFAAQRKG
jgi:hypothetical protein